MKYCTGIMASYVFWTQVSMLADLPILSQNRSKSTCCSQKSYLLMNGFKMTDLNRLRIPFLRSVVSLTMI